MVTFDEVMNWLMPILVILVVIGFLWIKTPLGSLLGPKLAEFGLWIKGESQNIHIKRDKVISYE